MCAVRITVSIGKPRYARRNSRPLFFISIFSLSVFDMGATALLRKAAHSQAAVLRGQAETMAKKSCQCKLAPPTKAPSTPSTDSSSAALSGFTEPP
jgi:hypothetical protein